MKCIYDVIQGPRLTEKSSMLKEVQDTVVFRVDPRANKIEIKNAVESLFNVKVKRVCTTRVRGKQKRVGIKSVGRTKDWKKAYVTLSEGEINFVDEL